MSSRATSTPTKQKHQTIIENTADGWMKIGRAGKKVVTEKLSPIKSVKDSKVKNSTVEFGSVSDDNVTLAGGVKRAMSGKHLTTDSLVAQTSIARGEGEASPPRKRRSSTSSEAELDVFDEHAKQFKVTEADPSRELQVVPGNLLAVHSDLTKKGEEKRVETMLTLVEQHAARSEAEAEAVRLEWDANGDLERSLYAEEDMEDGVEPPELHDVDIEALSETEEEKSVTPVNVFLNEVQTSMQTMEKTIETSLMAGMQTMVQSCIQSAMAQQFQEMEKQWKGKFLSTKEATGLNQRLASIEEVHSKDHEEVLICRRDYTATLVNVAELKKKQDEMIAASGEKDARYEAVLSSYDVKLKDMSDLIARLMAKLELQQQELSDFKSGTISVPSNAPGGEGSAPPIRAVSQFSESEVKDIKGAISHFKRNENSYWNRSIKVSNIGSIPKTGSRFVAIKENLRKFGLDFLMSHAESYYVYSSLAVRITFKSSLDRNYYVMKARHALKELENKTVWLDTLMSPDHFPKKQQLLHVGRNMKAQGLIKKFSCELYRGTVMLRTVDKDGKVDWVDLSSAGGASCVPVPVGRTRASGKGLREVGNVKAGGDRVSIDPRVAKNKGATAEPMDVEPVLEEGEIDESL